jgi:hypothetical protein
MIGIAYLDMLMEFITLILKGRLNDMLSQQHGAGRVTCRSHLPDFALIGSYFSSTKEMLFHPLAGKVRNTATRFRQAVLKTIGLKCI